MYAEGGKMVALIIIVVLVLWICVSCIKIVPQAQAYVIERLGAYQSTWNVGFNLKIPFIDKVARKVNLKEQVADFPPQPVITKDNVTMRIDTVVFYASSFSTDTGSPLLSQSIGRRENVSACFVIYRF